ncbi:MAG: hypothetical protein FWH38_07715 [Treponema sp.]|nr:hypothetical protein [Treponema sp.]
MAIQPIDLQTLFTQMDKVAKTQSAQREGLALQQTLQGIELQRKTDEQIRAVNEAQNTGEDGAEKVKDKGPHAHEGGRKKKKDSRREDSEPEKEDNKKPVINDPFLGRKIDISL